MSPPTQDNIINCSGLNPYYTGSYSMRKNKVMEKEIVLKVLILIILEVTL